jgi:hypothetical protein
LGLGLVALFLAAALQPAWFSDDAKAVIGVTCGLPVFAGMSIVLIGVTLHGYRKGWNLWRRGRVTTGAIEGLYEDTHDPELTLTYARVNFVTSDGATRHVDLLAPKDATIHQPVLVRYDPRDPSNAESAIPDPIIQRFLIAPFLHLFLWGMIVTSVGMTVLYLYYLIAKVLPLPALR